MLGLGQRRQIQNPGPPTGHPVLHLPDVELQGADTLRPLRIHPVDDVGKDASSANRWQLVRVADEDQPLNGPEVDRTEEGGDQPQVHHRGLVDDVVGLSVFSPAAAPSEGQVVVQPVPLDQERLDGCRLFGDSFAHPIRCLARGGQQLERSTRAVGLLDGMDQDTDDRCLPGSRFSGHDADWSDEDLRAHLSLTVDRHGVILERLRGENALLVMEGALPGMRDPREKTGNSV